GARSRTIRTGDTVSTRNGCRIRDTRLAPMPLAIVGPAGLGSRVPWSGPCGGVPEWLNGAVSKTVKGGDILRGFESLPLRQPPSAERSLQGLANAKTAGVWRISGPGS